MNQSWIWLWLLATSYQMRGTTAGVAATATVGPEFGGCFAKALVRGGAVAGCFPYIGLGRAVWGSGDVGAVPGAGVDVERGEDLVLEGAGAGDEGDVAAGGGEVDVSDPVEFS